MNEFNRLANKAVKYNMCNSPVAIHNIANDWYVRWCFSWNEI